MEGHIRKRTHTNTDGRESVKWYVVVELDRSADGRRRQKWHGGFRTRKQAEVARAKLVRDLHAGTYHEPSRITLREWVSETWLPTIRTQVKPSTFESYERNITQHVLPRLGNRRLTEITAPSLTLLYGELLEFGRRNGNRGGLSPKTVRYVHTIVHKALADAVDAGVLATNVAERAKPPRPRAAAPTEIMFWEPLELRAFLAMVAAHRLEAGWHLSAMTGMRRGEVLGLRWRDIDFDAKRVHVRQALVSVAYNVIVSSPKNHQSRVIDIDSVTADHLRAHRVRQQRERDEWGAEYEDGGLVFCKENGTPIHPQTFSQAFDRIVDKSDLPKIRLHDLRHTHATIALRAGVPVKVISERLGHESPAFTLKQYTHVIPGMQAEAAMLIATLVQGTAGTIT